MRPLKKKRRESQPLSLLWEYIPESKDKPWSPRSGEGRDSFITKAFFHFWSFFLYEHEMHFFFGLICLRPLLWIREKRRRIRPSSILAFLFLLLFIASGKVGGRESEVFFSNHPHPQTQPFRSRFNWGLLCREGSIHSYESKEVRRSVQQRPRQRLEVQGQQFR